MPNFFLESVKDEPLTSLNDRSDLSRMAYQNKSSDIPLRNNSMTDRFESDNFINHKESFENNNSRINSLNEEIRELKEKLKSVYEKDDQIITLELECNALKGNLDELTQLKNESQFIKDENKLLKGKLKEYDEKEKLSLAQKSDPTDTDSEGYVGPVKDEQIAIDVLQLKRVLFARLKDYHEKHIDELIDQYDLTKKKEIDKSILEQILLKAIHV